MHWLQRKKPELISMDHFWKNETWPSKKSNKFELFFEVFFCFFLTDHDYRLFECFYEVSWSTDFNSTETSHVLCTIFEKIGKNCIKGYFFLDLLDGQFAFIQKNSIKMSSGFLRCNQCIKTLLLSYQTSPSHNFIFHLCKGRAVFEKKVPTCQKLVEIDKQKHFWEQ